MALISQHRMAFLLGTLILLTLLLAAPAGAQEVLFENFSGTFTVRWGLPFHWNEHGGQDAAARFTVQGADSMVLDAFHLSLARFPDPPGNSFRLDVVPDAGGLPDVSAIIETIEVLNPSPDIPLATCTPFPCTTSATIVNSVTNPLLVPGTYWLTIRGLDPMSSIVWWDVPGAINPTATRHTSSGFVWTIATERNAGLRVLGHAPDACAGISADRLIDAIEALDPTPGGPMTGNSAQANQGRKGALVNRVLEAQQLAQAGDVTGALDALASALRKLTGNNPWVTGQAAADLSTLLNCASAAIKGGGLP